MKKICYTYFEDLDGINKWNNYSQKDLIEICKKSWEKNGWKIMVIGEKDACDHPLFNLYKSTVLSFPTANAYGYDYHCYIRWLAMANLGGGIMIDYDVVNLGINDIDFFKFDELTIYQGHVPCVVSGTSQHYLEFVKFVIDNKKFIADNADIWNGEPHTSDMIILSKTEKFKKIDFVSSYPEIGLLTHCSQNDAHKNNKNKFQIMRELIDDNLPQ